MIVTTHHATDLGDVEITIRVSGGEKTTRHHPGCGPDVEIEGVIVDGEEVHGAKRDTIIAKIGEDRIEADAIDTAIGIRWRR